MGTSRKSAGATVSETVSGEEKMGTEVKTVEGGIEEGFSFTAPDMGIDLSDVKVSDLPLYLLKGVDLDELSKQPLYPAETVEETQKDSVKEISAKKTSGRRGTRTIPEPKGDLVNVYVIPSLRYGLVCMKVHADAHITKEGAITIKHGMYVPAGRWAWSLEDAKKLLADKINDTISSHQNLINIYAALNNPPVLEGGIDEYTRLCGRGKTSIESYILGVHNLPEAKEKADKDD